jgi:hypothetical protein
MKEVVHDGLGGNADWSGYRGRFVRRAHRGAQATMRVRSGNRPAQAPVPLRPSSSRSKEASTRSHRPVVYLYSRQSGLDVAVLWAALDRHCLHVLHEDDQRSLLLFGVRLFARTAHAGDHSAIETALAEGPVHHPRISAKCRTRSGNPDRLPADSRSHPQAWHPASGPACPRLAPFALVGLVPFGSTAPPFATAAAGAVRTARSRRSATGSERRHRSARQRSGS